MLFFGTFDLTQKYQKLKTVDKFLTQFDQGH